MYTKDSEQIQKTKQLELQTAKDYINFHNGFAVTNNLVLCSSYLIVCALVPWSR